MADTVSDTELGMYEDMEMHKDLEMDNDYNDIGFETYDSAERFKMYDELEWADEDLEMDDNYDDIDLEMYNRLSAEMYDEPEWADEGLEMGDDIDFEMYDRLSAEMYDEPEWADEGLEMGDDIDFEMYDRLSAEMYGEPEWMKYTDKDLEMGDDYDDIGFEMYDSAEQFNIYDEPELAMYAEKGLYGTAGLEMDHVQIARDTDSMYTYGGTGMYGLNNMAAYAHSMAMDIPREMESETNMGLNNEAVLQAGEAGCARGNKMDKTCHFSKLF